MQGCKLTESVLAYVDTRQGSGEREKSPGHHRDVHFQVPISKTVFSPWPFIFPPVRCAGPTPACRTCLDPLWPSSLCKGHGRKHQSHYSAVCLLWGYFNGLAAVMRGAKLKKVGEFEHMKSFLDQLHDEQDAQSRFTISLVKNSVVVVHTLRIVWGLKVNSIVKREFEIGRNSNSKRIRSATRNWQ